MRHRHFRHSDEGVSEVVACILAFGVSAILLTGVALFFNFVTTRTTGESAQGELAAIAQDVSRTIQTLASSSQIAPTSTFSVMLEVPRSIAGSVYTITAEPDIITVTTRDNAYSATATTFRLGASPDLVVAGTAESWNEQILVTSQRDSDGILHIEIQRG